MEKHHRQGWATVRSLSETGYDRKSVRLSHDAPTVVHIQVQADLTGTGLWKTWKSYPVQPGQTVEDEFPTGFQAYWVRAVADNECRATAVFRCE